MLTTSTEIIANAKLVRTHPRLLREVGDVAVIRAKLVNPHKKPQMTVLDGEFGFLTPIVWVKDKKVWQSVHLHNEHHGENHPVDDR